MILVSLPKDKIPLMSVLDMKLKKYNGEVRLR